MASKTEPRVARAEPPASHVKSARTAAVISQPHLRPWAPRAGRKTLRHYGGFCEPADLVRAAGSGRNPAPMVKRLLIRLPYPLNLSARFVLSHGGPSPADPTSIATLHDEAIAERYGSES
jgi:hypothetical protein